MEYAPYFSGKEIFPVDRPQDEQTDGATRPKSDERCAAACDVHHEEGDPVRHSRRHGTEKGFPEIPPEGDVELPACIQEDRDSVCRRIDRNENSCPRKGPSGNAKCKHPDSHRHDRQGDFHEPDGPVQVQAHKYGDDRLLGHEKKTTDREDGHDSSRIVSRSHPHLHDGIPQDREEENHGECQCNAITCRPNHQVLYFSLKSGTLQGTGRRGQHERVLVDERLAAPDEPHGPRKHREQGGTEISCDEEAAPLYDDQGGQPDHDCFYAERQHLLSLFPGGFLITQIQFRADPPYGKVPVDFRRDSCGKVHRRHGSKPMAHGKNEDHEDDGDPVGNCADRVVEIPSVATRHYSTEGIEHLLDGKTGPQEGDDPPQFVQVRSLNFFEEVWQKPDGCDGHEPDDGCDDDLDANHRGNGFVQPFPVSLGSQLCDIPVDGGPDSQARQPEIADQGPGEIPDSKGDLTDVPVDHPGHHESGYDEHHVPAPARQDVPDHTLTAREIRGISAVAFFFQRGIHLTPVRKIHQAGFEEQRL